MIGKVDIDEDPPATDLGTGKPAHPGAHAHLFRVHLEKVRGLFKGERVHGSKPSKVGMVGTSRRLGMPGRLSRSMAASAPPSTNSMVSIRRP